MKMTELLPLKVPSPLHKPFFCNVIKERYIFFLLIQCFTGLKEKNVSFLHNITCCPEAYM